MAKPTLNDLNAFAAIATHLSFRRAAHELGVAPSSLSHTMRTLERDFGVRLLNRTTRSVSVTEAGKRLLARLRPVLDDLYDALDEVEAFRENPSGTVRINAPQTAIRLLLRHMMPVFSERFPDIAVDFVAEGRLIDIVADGFDAGIRLGETVPQDMIGVHFGGEMRFVAVASPAYLSRLGTPGVPEDLLKHDCIRNRLPSGKLYRWEFERHGQELTVDVPGRLTLDNMELMLEAAVDGFGVAYVLERAARPYLEEGRLATVLGDWCPPIPGLFLYYPGRRQVRPALRAFIDTLRRTMP
ncbi:LysR family transcriptional regulator [Rhizobium binxianense]